MSLAFVFTAALLLRDWLKRWLGAVAAAGSVSLLVVLPAYGTNASPHPLAPDLVVEAVNDKVIVLTGKVPDKAKRELVMRELVRMRQPDRLYPAFAGYVNGLSGSGIETNEGEIRPVIHFATIRDKNSDNRMRLLLQLASTQGQINRSSIGWAGDHFPGIRARAGVNLQDPKDSRRMSAVAHVVLPGQAVVHFIRVGYDVEGKQIAPLGGRTGLEDFVKKSQGSK